MHYRVIYLAVNERETMRLLAPNAATAVALAKSAAGDRPRAFELLSVAPEPELGASRARDGSRRSDHHD